MNIFESALQQVDIEKARAEVADQGWYLLNTPLPEEALRQIKAEIDGLASAEGTEVNYGGSECRVWKAHEKSDAIDQFRVFSDAVISKVDGERREAFDILAIRNLTLASDDTTSRKGRWHLDSFRRQLKIFIFLTDVTQESGPFEMIPGTQATSFKMKQALQGNLITPKDLVEGTRSYSRLKEELIERILAKGYETKTFNVPAGSIALVDTSCVHRARPCVAGERYALTSYYA